MSSRLVAAVLCFAFSAGAIAAESTLENPQPNAIESGITAISGWYCPAAAITIQVDSAAPFTVPYGSERADAAPRCGGALKTGFSYLFNYNTLSTGKHTIKAFADGVQFASVEVNVVTLGAEFLAGKAGEYILNNFPDYGKRTRVTWQQSKQNFVVSGTDTNVASIDGTYFGAITRVNSGCTNTALNGGFFEVFKFDAKFGANSALTVTAANSGLTCTFGGIAFYTNLGGHIVVPAGDFSCTDGTKGTWASERLLFDEAGMLGNIAFKYTTGETCTSVGHVGAAR